jgi:hypothetical protein
MLIQLVKLLDEDLHEHLRQEVSIWLVLLLTRCLPVHAHTIDCCQTTGNRLLTVWVPLDKLSHASRDSVSSLSAPMGTYRFHFERVAAIYSGFYFSSDWPENVLWLSGYVCCWEQSSRWLYSILLRSTFAELGYQVESYGFSGYHRFLATPADRELDTCGGNYKD